MSDESLFPVSKLQCALANMNSHVKRKLIILDCRIESMKTLQRKNRYVFCDQNTIYFIKIYNFGYPYLKMPGFA